MLAINPGSRYLGIAVFYDQELRDWGIKVVKGKCGQEKIETAMNIIFEIINQHQIGIIALKALHPSRSSDHLDQLVRRIKDSAKRKSLKIHEYPLAAVESNLAEGGKINKRQLAELISQTYPYLSHELEKEKYNLNPYHVRMFEAVALGLVCLNDVNKNRSSR